MEDKIKKGRIFSQQEMENIFGKPNKEGTYLVTIELPYTMYYDKQPIKKMRCHKKVAPYFLAVFNEILKVYGAKKNTRIRNRRLWRLF